MIYLSNCLSLAVNEDNNNNDKKQVIPLSRNVDMPPKQNVEEKETNAEFNYLPLRQKLKGNEKMVVY